MKCTEFCSAAKCPGFLNNLRPGMCCHLLAARRHVKLPSVHQADIKVKRKVKLAVAGLVWSLSVTTVITILVNWFSYLCNRTTDRDWEEIGKKLQNCCHIFLSLVYYVHLFLVYSRIAAMLAYVGQSLFVSLHALFQLWETLHRKKRQLLHLNVYRSHLNTKMQYFKCHEST